MGNRVYLSSKAATATAWTPRLEANNTLPLAWLMLIAVADLESARMNPGLLHVPSMRLTEGSAVGVVLKTAHAVALAVQRSERVSAWLGEPAGQVLQQFAAHITDTADPELYLDLSEWFDEHANQEEGWQWLRNTIATLDSPPRRGARLDSVPRTAAQLLRSLELKSADHALPWFGQGMAGTACKGIEAWRRYPPRPERKADDHLAWSLEGGGERCLISADGETMVVLAKNRQDLATPIIRSADGKYARLPLDTSTGRFWMTGLSANGKVLLGSREYGLMAETHTYRYSVETGFETLTVEEKNFVGVALSADGNTAVGYVHSDVARSHDKVLPAVWHRGKEQVIAQPGQASLGHASLVSADGTVVVGKWHQGPRSTQPFAWSESSGALDLGGDFNALNWRAISPDGRAGIFRANTVEDRTDMTYRWTWDQGVRRCDDAQGEPLKEGYACSTRADAVVGLTKDPDDRTAFTAHVWKADGPYQQVDLGAGWSTLGIERVGPRGTWFCFRGTRSGDHGVYVWHDSKPLQKLDLPPVLSTAFFSVSAASDPARPGDLVMLCKSSSPDHHTLLAPRNQELLPVDPTRIS